MEVKKIYSFEDFEPWSGAIETWEKLQEFDKIGTLEATLEDFYPDGIDETELNDILWFDEESVFDWVGLYYNSDTDVVSDEPLCYVCEKYIPEAECEQCMQMVCSSCAVKCSICGKQLCKDCAIIENDGIFCDECWDNKEE